MGNEVQEIKLKADMAQIISEYVKLTPAGINFKGRCPFHQEKTPSFIVSPDKQIWHCFGCAKGGDIFTFVMEIENCDFPEALKILAKKTGVELQKLDPKITNQKTRLLDINELAAKFFNYLLFQKQGSIALQYLKKRLVTDETANDFYLGYSPNSWDVLFNFLKQKGFNEKEIFDSGLVVKKDNNRGYYDRFRHRLMFPIRNIFGQVVGFTARVLEGDEKTAKYINTPQTLIYNKSQVIYGLDKAKQDIKKKDLCVVVEGNMDVISSHQAGVRNVVASSGTAFTDEQVLVLKRYSTNIALSFDADLAGQAAAARGIDTALKHGMNIKVISLEHKDPDDCIKDDPQKWLDAISKAKPFMLHSFEKIIAKKNLSNIDDKKKIAKEMLNLMAKLTDLVERNFWIQKTANFLDVPENVLRESLKSTVAAKPPIALKSPENTSAKPSLVMAGEEENFKQTALEVMLFGLIAKYPENLAYLIEYLEPKFIANEFFSKLYRYFILYYNEKKSDDTNKDFFNKFNVWLEKEDFSFAQNAKNKLSQAILLIEKDFYGFDKKEIQKEIVNIIKNLKKKYINERMKEIRREILQLEALENKDLGKIKSLSEEFNLLADQVMGVE